MPDDLYSLLGLKAGCSQDDIKQAYHRLAKLYHPDINRSAQAPEMMKRINMAYATLSDIEKRKMYDHRLYSSPSLYKSWNTGHVSMDQNKGYARSRGPYNDYAYTWQKNSYQGTISRSRNFKLYAIFLVIFILSTFYLFILPVVYEAHSDLTFSAMGSTAHTTIAATVPPQPSMAPTAIVFAAVPKPSPTPVASPTLAPEPAAVQTSGPGLDGKAHVITSAPLMKGEFGAGIVTGKVTVRGSLWPGSCYVAICDANNTSREYYNTTSGPGGYFQFAAVNNTIDEKGLAEKRYVLYAQNIISKSQGYSGPFGVEPYRIVNEAIVITADS